MDGQGNGTQEAPKASYSVLKYDGYSLPEQYKALVYSKWLRSLRYGNEYFKLIDQESYFKVYHQFIEVLLAHHKTIVRLAVITDSPDTVLGFSVMWPGILHYVHVHADQRKQGIAKTLCKDFKTITHITNDGLKIWGKYPEVKFNPFEVV